MQDLDKFNPIFQQSTDTFLLQLSQPSECLQVVLFDLFHKILYSKTYSNADIGSQIHRKADLADICQNFKPKLSTKVSIPTKTYQFSQVAFTAEDQPWYSVQPGGKVTIYTNVTFKKNDKEISQSYESCLSLKKVRDLTDKQLKHLQGKDKQVAPSNDQNVKQDSEKDKISIRKDLQALKIENKQLRQETVQLKCQLRLQQKQIFNLIEKSQEMARLYDKLEATVLQLKNGPYSFVNLKIGFPSQYKIQQNMITKTSCKLCHILFTQPVPVNSCYRFRIKIVKSPSRQILIGVCRSSAAQKQFTYMTGQALMLYTYNSNILPINNKQAGRIEQGAVVEVVVDRRNKSIRWLVEGQVVNQCTHELLGGGEQLLPNLEIRNEGNVVEWLGGEIC